MERIYFQAKCLLAEADPPPVRSFGLLTCGGAVGRLKDCSFYFIFLKFNWFLFLVYFPFFSLVYIFPVYLSISFRYWFDCLFIVIVIIIIITSIVSLSLHHFYLSYIIILSFLPPFFHSYSLFINIHEMRLSSRLPHLHNPQIYTVLARK